MDKAFFHSLAILCLILLAFCALAKECESGCDPDHAVCDNGECRCNTGWKGATCEQCVPFPGCVHGTCEKAWQCVCEQGWAGKRCDQDSRPCSSKPCSGNSTCAETEEGGYLCICPPGFTGKRCRVKKGQCLINGSPCQNGGTCVNSDGPLSCLCPLGFAGAFCEFDVDACGSDPCQNGGTCTGRGLVYACVCPPTFSGPVCNISLASCSNATCGNGATCLPETGGGTRCVCPSGITGPLCDVHIRKSKPLNITRSSQIARPFNKLLKHPEHKFLKFTMKDPARASSPLVTRSQVICFAVLGLLTCLVVLGTTSIIYFNRCETWLANAKYTKLMRKQRDFLLRSGDTEHSVHIILPEKIKLTNYRKNYTTI